MPARHREGTTRVPAARILSNDAECRPFCPGVVNMNARISIALALGTLGIATVQAQTLVAIDPAAGRAAGINANGDVILDTHIYSGGTITPLGSGNTIIWPNTPSTSAPMTRGAAINDAGETVGVLVEQGAHRAANGTITNLAEPVGIHSIAINRPLAINDAGVLAGITYTSS